MDILVGSFVENFSKVHAIFGQDVSRQLKQLETNKVPFFTLI
jgi:hypothetical protein